MKAGRRQLSLFGGAPTSPCSPIARSPSGRRFGRRRRASPWSAVQLWRNEPYGVWSDGPLGAALMGEEGYGVLLALPAALRLGQRRGPPRASRGGEGTRGRQGGARAWRRRRRVVAVGVSRARWAHIPQKFGNRSRPLSENGPDSRLEGREGQGRGERPEPESSDAMSSRDLAARDLPGVDSPSELFSKSDTPLVTDRRVGAARGVREANGTADAVPPLLSDVAMRDVAERLRGSLPNGCLVAASRPPTSDRSHRLVRFLLLPMPNRPPFPDYLMRDEDAGRRRPDRL